MKTTRLCGLYRDPASRKHFPNDRGSYFKVMVVLVCISYFQSVLAKAQQSCPISSGAGCIFQDQTTYQEGSKCGFNEFLSWDPPVVHVYHDQTTELKKNYSYSWSDGNGCYYWVGPDGWQTYAGPYSSSETYNYDVTEYESKTGTSCYGTSCYYTNWFGGGWSDSSSAIR